MTATKSRDGEFSYEANLGRSVAFDWTEHPVSNHNAAPPRPLSESDLLNLLAGGVYPSRVANLVEERGITFAPTEDDLSSLRQAGGGDTVARAVIAAAHLATPQGLNPPNTRHDTQATVHSLHNEVRSPSSPVLLVPEASPSPSSSTGSLPAKPANILLRFALFCFWSSR
jgi:hypothetical protein